MIPVEAGALIRCRLADSVPVQLGVIRALEDPECFNAYLHQSHRR